MTALTLPLLTTASIPVRSCRARNGHALRHCYMLCPLFRETVGANPLGTCWYDIEHFAAVLHW